MVRGALLTQLTPIEFQFRIVLDGEFQRLVRYSRTVTRLQYSRLLFSWRDLECNDHLDHP